MTSETTATSTPIVCDMTGAPDTVEERLAEYARLFARALAGRERTEERVRLRFDAVDGIEDWVRDLAVREKACCPFYDFTVTATDGQVWWDIRVADDAVVDDAMARALLDEYYNAPDTVADGVAGMKARLTEEGVQITTDASGAVMRFRLPGTGA